MKALLALQIVILTAFQPAPTVVKNNGDVVSFSKIEIAQDKVSSSSEQIKVAYGGKEVMVALSDVKRINLKGANSKSKGVTTWNALLVKKSGEKMEVLVAINEVRGTDASGGNVKVLAGNIDKISF